MNMEEDDDDLVQGKSVGDQSQSVRGRSQRGRGRKRTRSLSEDVRTSHRTPKWVSQFTTEQKWSLTELSRLLEALKRYEPHNLSNIAFLVGTKSEKEVEEKIQSLQQAYSLVGRNDRVAGSDTENAPIEAWIDLMQEMTNYEPADYTQFIPQILGYITRNETFADSGYDQLKWRNIYQYLTDVSMDRVEVQRLTDMESLVLLDLMHSLGDTLYNSDTAEQRRILDFKYNLLNFRAEHRLSEERELINQRIAQALSNDFWDPEDIPGLDSTTSTSSMSSSSTSPTTSVVSSPSASCTSASYVSCHDSPVAGSSSQPDGNHCTNSTQGQTNDQRVIPILATGTETCSETAQAHTVQSDISQAAIPVANDHQSDTNVFVAIPSPNKTCKSGKADITMSSRNPQSKTKLPQRSREGRIGLRPKFFTLNPLCVSAQHLPFRPKSQNRSAEGQCHHE